MHELPDLEQFPDESANVPDCGVYTKFEGYGILAAQDGEDLYRIGLHMALSDDPRDGFVSVEFDAQGARELAAHLIHLAEYAELGVEAKPR